MTRLSVAFLGTSSAAPTEGRGLPAMVLQREGKLVILDSGEGIQRQIIKMGFGLNRDTIVLITHLHGDHVTGLLGLLQTMSMAQRTKPLTIVAPAALLKWLEVTSAILHIGLTFDIQFVQAKPGVVLRTHDFLVRAARAEHSVEAYSYVVEERNRPGSFYPEKARKLGVPEGRLWSRLQKGRSVVVGGRRVVASEVTGRQRPGRKVGYSGDTRPSRRLSRFFKGCDLLIFDSTFSESDRTKAIERKHSTSREAAVVARDAGARELVLTHFSARYRTVSALVRDARKVFPHTSAAYDGMEVAVGFPDQSVSH